MSEPSDADDHSHECEDCGKTFLTREAHDGHRGSRVLWDGCPAERSDT